MKPALRNKDTGNFLVRYIKSLAHALNGLWYAIRYEHNMYIILLAIIVVTSLGIYFQITTIEWLLCIFSFGIVLATELLNTAIEAVSDAITIKQNQLIKIAKDTASAASLICCMTTAIIGLTIFIPKIISLF